VITDLLDNQAALARAEGSYAEARWSYFAARAAFERATGGAP
jgi:outer membrane protein TolC